MVGLLCLKCFIPSYIISLPSSWSIPGGSRGDWHTMSSGHVRPNISPEPKVAAKTIQPFPQVGYGLNPLVNPHLWVYQCTSKSSPHWKIHLFQQKFQKIKNPMMACLNSSEKFRCEKISNETNGMIEILWFYDEGIAIDTSPVNRVDIFHSIHEVTWCYEPWPSLAWRFNFFSQTCLGWGYGTCSQEGICLFNKSVWNSMNFLMCFFLHSCSCW